MGPLWDALDKCGLIAQLPDHSCINHSTTSLDTTNLDQRQPPVITMSGPTSRRHGQFGSDDSWSSSQAGGNVQHASAGATASPLLCLPLPRSPSRLIPPDHPTIGSFAGHTGNHLQERGAIPGQGGYMFVPPVNPNPHHMPLQQPTSTGPMQGDFHSGQPLGLQIERSGWATSSYAIGETPNVPNAVQEASLPFDIGQLDCDISFMNEESNLDSSDDSDGFKWVVSPPGTPTAEKSYKRCNWCGNVPLRDQTRYRCAGVPCGKWVCGRCQNRHFDQVGFFCCKCIRNPSCACHT